MNNLLKILDDFLRALSNSTQEKPINLAELKAQYSNFRDISDRDWEAMRLKLYNDKMITFIKKSRNLNNPNSTFFNAYFITFNGLLLLNYENGYEGR